ncbi:anti-sigma factor antagonist [Leptospira fluminis]|uniref:Anti-sigma factor antagonist n=1 Tax=Leptospira fluminis TaxID=2484979 RepID=A0A4R9GP33_9LEPT|nr:STAS domain-containing protein [Leptospira fluminis]TGK17333.1 anti-sigma factor antagonist [Leptospira fluminis]
MELKTSRIRNILRISPVGVLDSHSSPDFLRFLKSRWEEGERLFLVVCDSIPYLEEEGISCLSELKSFLKENGGQVAFSNWNEECKLILGLFGMNSSLQSFSEEKSGVEWLSSLKIEDRRSTRKKASLSELRQTKPFQFYSSPQSVSPEEKTFPEIRSLPTVEEEFSKNVAPEEPKKRQEEDFPAESKLEQSVERIRSTQERILYCESCHSRLRIRLPGRYKCPSCGIQFDLNRMGGVRYLERLLVSPE